jgi:hypothetical protein
LPPSYEDTKLQLYPRSLEPHKGPGQGKDFSLLSALATAALLHALPACKHTEGFSADTAHPPDDIHVSPAQHPLSTAEINISDNALSASPDPDRALPTVPRHKKWNDDVLICEHLLRVDSAPFELPCLAPLPPPSAVPPADDDTRPIGYSRWLIPRSGASSNALNRVSSLTILGCRTPPPRCFFFCELFFL